MNDTDIIGLIVTCVLFGLLVGVQSAMTYSEKQAIDHGAARYHPVTGEFEWTMPLIKESK